MQAKSLSTSPGVEPGESFASQRGGIAENTEQVGSATGPFVTGPVTNKTLPPMRVVPGKGVVLDTSVDPNEFPLPFAVSGTKPKIGTKPTLTQSPESKAVKPDGSAGPDSASGGRAAAAAPARKKMEPSRATDRAAGADPASSSNDASNPDESDPAKKKPRKLPKLDPDILQRALQLRNQGR